MLYTISRVNLRVQLNGSEAELLGVVDLTRQVFSTILPGIRKITNFLINGNRLV